MQPDELPTITRSEARDRALDALIASLLLTSPDQRAEVFRKKGFLIKGKNELLYRSREHNGELVSLDAKELVGCRQKVTHK